ncbi:hypothetical protein EZV62_017094 [Acer yangbiense]|uniref:Uncharacterized protein n=1 Tax=Acer yangbiense TaxID=1000413 RepID=A0A5C7HFQ5_9ROSI|nr:hypothetical protein EZV62_017094 [Acer yangbiense]
MVVVELLVMKLSLSLQNPKHTPLYLDTQMVLEFLLLVGFSTLPLAQYVPPVRNLNTIVERLEEFIRNLQPTLLHPRMRFLWTTLLNFMFCNFTIDSYY